MFRIKCSFNSPRPLPSPFLDWGEFPMGHQVLKGSKKDITLGLSHDFYREAN